MYSKFSSFIDILEQSCSDNLPKVAYTFLEDGELIEKNITYEDLQISARSIAAYLQQRLNPGDRVLLMFNPGLDFITTFYGCLYAGIIAIPTYPLRLNRNVDQLTAIILNSGAKIVLTNSTSYSKTLSNNLGIKVINIGEISTEWNVEWRRPTIVKEDIAFLQYTSGSTGNPKGVIITHKNIIHNQQLIKSAFSQNEKSLIVGWLPFYHDMGLIGNILHPAFLGARSVLMSPVHFLQKPSRWLDAISQYKGTTSGGPNFAYDLCINRISEEHKEKLDLSSWSVAFCGAEPIRPSTLTHFSKKFATCGFGSRSFQACYGMAEATLLIAAERHGNGLTTLKIPTTELAFIDSVDTQKSPILHTDLVGCGYPKEFDLVIVDKNHRPLPEGKVGEIWVKGESVAKGYW
ncbi:MAG: fatty acyl-AMP ligase, partial [Sphingobacteriales bacterium]